MIKYSATDMCGNVVDECLQLFYGYMWIIQLPECMPIISGADLCGTNEIMKILIARGLFKDMLK
jgi:acyl-CoA dehydrogenase